MSETAIKINFSWTDSLKPGKQVSQFSWAYERASALYNLAACSSFLGANTNRSEPAGIEAAAKHFSTAAGVLAHLRDVAASQVCVCNVGLCHLVEYSFQNSFQYCS